MVTLSARQRVENKQTKKKPNRTPACDLQTYVAPGLLLSCTSAIGMLNHRPPAIYSHETEKLKDDDQIKKRKAKKKQKKRDYCSKFLLYKCDGCTELRNKNGCAGLRLSSVWSRHGKQKPKIRTRANCNCTREEEKKKQRGKLFFNVCAYYYYFSKQSHSLKNKTKTKHNRSSSNQKVTLLFGEINCSLHSPLSAGLVSSYCSSAVTEGGGPPNEKQKGNASS